MPGVRIVIRDFSQFQRETTDREISSESEEEKEEREDGKTIRHCVRKRFQVVEHRALTLSE